MGKFRLESYSGKSMEAGPDGWDGIRRAEAYRGIDDEEEIDELREHMSCVPMGGENDEFSILKENSLEGVPLDNDVDILTLSDELEYIGDDGEDNYEEFLAQIEAEELPKEQGKYFHSMSMSDIARDITKGIDAPTQRDVKNATKIDLEEIVEEGYDEFDKYMAEIE